MKKIVAILLILVLALTLIACGDKANEAQQPEQGEKQANPVNGNVPEGDNPDASQPITTAAPSVPCKEMTHSGLKFYIPEQWTGSEANGSFAAISNDYYNDLGSIVVSRNQANVPVIAANGELTQDQAAAAVSGLISDSEIHITSTDINVTLAGYPAIKAYLETEIDGLKMYMILFVTVSPDASNFIMAASSLNYADIATFENLFTYTVIG